jgi:hypothetical protein
MIRNCCLCHCFHEAIQEEVGTVLLLDNVAWYCSKSMSSLLPKQITVSMKPFSIQEEVT